jgi:hypothetical protein
MNLFYQNHRTGVVEFLGNYPRVRDALEKNAIPVEALRDIGGADRIAAALKTGAKALLESGTPTTYTVVLLTPDYLADNFGQDTYMAHVVATSPAEAIAKARTDVCTARKHEDEEDGNNYFVIAVFVGELEDLNHER